MNNEREVMAKLKSILEEIGVDYTNILLLGSRTGGVFEEECDWDFLIVVKGNLDIKEKRRLKTLEKENLKKVKHVYNSLVNTNKIQKYIEQIKSPIGVKIIEPEANRNA